MNTMRIAQARLAVVQAKIAAPGKRVVARFNDTHKVTKERALATARHKKRRSLKMFMQWPALSNDRVNSAKTYL